MIRKVQKRFGEELNNANNSVKDSDGENNSAKDSEDAASHEATMKNKKHSYEGHERVYRATQYRHVDGDAGQEKEYIF